VGVGGRGVGGWGVRGCGGCGRGGGGEGWGGGRGGGGCMFIVGTDRDTSGGVSNCIWSCNNAKPADPPPKCDVTWTH